VAETTIGWASTVNEDGTTSPGYTFNPWVGCQAKSEGCAHCYAKRDFGRKPAWANCWGPPGKTERKRTSEANWRKPLAWDRKANEQATIAAVFCGSLCDVFEDAPGLDEIRRDLWYLIANTTNLKWLLLTKRPENVQRFAPANWPQNAALGVTAENQAWADSRIDVALSAKAMLGIPMLFVSAEPLLGEIDFSPWTWEKMYPSTMGFTAHTIGSFIDWIIVGGESGPQARSMHPQWARKVRDYCQMTKTPFFFKQWGEWIKQRSVPDRWTRVCFMDDVGVMHKPTNGLEFWWVGRKVAGRLLDGREWNELPEFLTVKGG